MITSHKYFTLKLHAGHDADAVTISKISAVYLPHLFELDILDNDENNISHNRLKHIDERNLKALAFQKDIFDRFKWHLN